MRSESGYRRSGARGLRSFANAWRSVHTSPGSVLRAVSQETTDPQFRFPRCGMSIQDRAGRPFLLDCCMRPLGRVSSAKRESRRTARRFCRKSAMAVSSRGFVALGVVTVASRPSLYVPRIRRNQGGFSAVVPVSPTLRLPLRTCCPPSPSSQARTRMRSSVVALPPVSASPRRVTDRVRLPLRRSLRSARGRSTPAVTRGRRESVSLFRGGWARVQANGRGCLLCRSRRRCLSTRG